MIQLGTILNLNFNVMLQFRTLECKKWQLNHKIIIIIVIIRSISPRSSSCIFVFEGKNRHDNYGC